MNARHINLLDQEAETLTLSEFNYRIKNTVNYDQNLQLQWVQAETSDVQVRRGHCYLELIEKNPHTGAIIARAQAVIWASTFARIHARFVKVTGQTLGNSMKVMVRASASYHELYGLKLLVDDINPEFTLGDLARQRQEIIDRLTREGIIDMNKTLEWPLVAQRIAVVSAPGAAGYGDFVNQLDNNPHHLKFYHHLFPAVMQGENTVPSIIHALDSILEALDLFDCVVIIRGGGSTSDLNAFDNYDLAAHIAQFPIPVIVGIGHERDVTVLDHVAAMRVKTPTAAAEWLLAQGVDALAHLNALGSAVLTAARDITAHAREQLAYYSSLLPAVVHRLTDTCRMQVRHLAQSIPMAAAARTQNERHRLTLQTQLLGSATRQVVNRETMRLNGLADKVELLSPQNTLNRGYTLTLLNGHCVTDAGTLKPGDVVTTMFKHGTAQATVLSATQN